ncbi:MAG: type II toxin-antitoxin system death-on-curing family toxin [Candidatus Subteraquimicrobiales bacterium]|nr:type II toxin-antitoxin system death-on-curing family toxin [Candidatus Subteraquimicrobiales bacterium]
MEWNEPIPDFSTRYPGILESCVANAFQTYGKKELYPTLLDKAAMIFYQMIKNHPFVNGNKRVAVTTLLTFLFLNNKWMEVTNEQLYNLAVFVAESQPKLKKSVVLFIKDFIRQSLVPFEE